MFGVYHIVEAGAKPKLYNHNEVGIYKKIFK